MSPTLTALRDALRTDTLADWLALLPAAERAPVARTLHLDARLLADHPDSLESLLLLRTAGDAALAERHAAWLAELSASGRPFLRPLRGLPLPPGLLAVLIPSPDVPIDKRGPPQFVDEDTITIPRREADEVIRWSWRTDTVTTAPGTAWQYPRDPRITHPQWGPSYLTRTPGEDPVALPCPAEATATARFIDGDRKLLVYGSLDEYDGGFAYLVDTESLAILRSLTTREPVNSISACSQPGVFLIRAGGAMLWTSEGTEPLPLSNLINLSPSGKRGLTPIGQGGLAVWDLATARPTGGRRGFTTQFSPDGERLLIGADLCEAHTGRRVAALEPRFGSYLEGGPAQPSMHLGTRHLINLHTTLEVWRTDTGVTISGVPRLRFPQWFTLAYDRAGDTLAAHRRGTVNLHPLPAGDPTTITLSADSQAIALSPDGTHLAAAIDDTVEIRSRSGALVRTLMRPPTNTESRRRRYNTALRYSHDGKRLAHGIGESWWIWDLKTGAGLPESTLEETPGFDAPPPADWEIAPGSVSVFTHLPCGARIALPLPGPWTHCPGRPEVVASQSAHLILTG